MPWILYILKKDINYHEDAPSIPLTKVKNISKTSIK